MRSFFAVLIVTSTVWAQTPTKPVPGQGAPPKALSVHADGHVSANADPTDADKFEVHVVKQGETLSQIAGEALKNPRLWPQLWEQNEHIINPHWIYPDDKILIRPVIPLVEAKPPEPPAETAVGSEPPPPPAAPPAPVQLAPPPVRAVVAPARPAQTVVINDTRRPAPEVKYADLYCSGFVRKAPVPHDLKVIGRVDATGAVLAGDADYVYLSQGSDDGIQTGNAYDVVRPTKTLINPYGRTAVRRDLGMHYLDVAQVKVVLTQPRFSLARVMVTCEDAVEVGDILMPFQPVDFPQPPRRRPFSPTMTVNGGAQGVIVAAKSVMLNFGSTFQMSGQTPGVRTDDRLGAAERGVAEVGSIVYIDIGEDAGVRPGDVFVAYRYVNFDQTLFPAPKETEKLKDVRTAVGEVIVVRVGERGATALVTYTVDALTLGDEVERR